MINYDSANILTLLKWKGSVFPKATKYAMIVSVLAALLKFAEQQDWLHLEGVKFITNSGAFSGFQFVLSFVIVFRASQCYTRFCQCAQSTCELRSQLAEAASSLITFTVMSKKPVKETKQFNHLLIRLFSLLHATALEVIAEQQHQALPVIDIHGIDEAAMKTLEGKTGKDKVDTVYQWINIIIVQNLSNGLLNIPPPILSRVFQELEKGMVSYNQVLQIMAIPFPFPYAQTTMVLSSFYLCLLPFIMMQWTDYVFSAFICTYVSIVSILSIEFTATELENPFGDDPNDLPCYSFQAEMNSSLLVLLDPDASKAPSLNDKAILNHKKLINAPFDKFGYGIEVVNEPEGPEAVREVSSETGSLEQEQLAQVPQVQQQSQPSHKAGSLEAKRQGEATGDEIGTLSGLSKPSNLQVKVEPRNKVPVSAPVECRDLGEVPPISDTKWDEKLAQDQQTAQEEMLQTLIGILERLDKPLSFSLASPLGNENNYSI